jgi:LacI family transcriptional regulator
MADMVRRHNYGLLIQNVSPNESNQFEYFLQPFQQRRIDGAVVTLGGPTELRQHYLTRLNKIKQPYVLLEQTVKPAANAACILGENRHGSLTAAKYLIDKGHTRIAYLTSILAWPAVEARICGYKDALQAHHLSNQPDLLTYCAAETPEAAYEATLALLETQPEVTAILGANDLLAVGALQAAQGLGRSVPEELAIIGFDDFNFAQYVRPKLTTVHLPGYEMGSEAARLLLDYFRTGAFETNELRLPTNLIVRDST